MEQLVIIIIDSTKLGEMTNSEKKKRHLYGLKQR